MNSILRRWIAPCLSLFVAAALGAGVLAQKPSSLLDDARRMQDIATQRAESEVQAALREARSAKPGEALAILKRALDRLDRNDDINADRRASMMRTLKDNIRLTESAAGATGGRGMDDTPKAIRDRRRMAEDDKQAAERDKVRQALIDIERMQNQGRSSEADKAARDLARDYPENPAARMMRGNASMKSRLDDARAAQREQGARTDSVLGKDMVKSNTPSIGDVEFDKKRWKELDQIRKDGKLTDKEKALLAALDTPVIADWRNVRFEDVIERLATASGQAIFIDKKALEEQNLTYDSPVTFVATQKISMRSALRKVLADNGLSYVIKDETIYVTTTAKARETMTTRVYYVGDLVNGTEFTNGTRYVPAVTMAAKAENAKMIVDMIKQSVDPMSWQGDGGGGTITYNPLADAIIVRQSAEIHLMLRKSLK